MVLEVTACNETANYGWERVFYLFIVPYGSFKHVFRFCGALQIWHNTPNAEYNLCARKGNLHIYIIAQYLYPRLCIHNIYSIN